MSDPDPAGPIYLDYNATTPVDPRVIEAAQPYLAEHFGNPSSAHGFGRAPAAALIAARRQVAELIGGTPDGIVFTGSGSEANNLAIRGTVLAAVRAENPVHGSDQQSCSLSRPAVMITDHVPAVRLPPDHAGGRMAAAVAA